MAAAAACYALHTEPVGNVGDYLRFWPWAAEWWKPGLRRRNLVKAGALILAELERLDRAAERADFDEGTVCEFCKCRILNPEEGPPCVDEAQAARCHAAGNDLDEDQPPVQSTGDK